MGNYLIMVNNGECTFNTKTTDDKIEALRLCRKWNEDDAILGYKYFVLRDSDGQTWECINGQMYRVNYKADSANIEYKAVAI